MKKLCTLLTAGILLLLLACMNPVDNSSRLMDKQRCRFELPAELSLKKIDTALFSKEGYFKIEPIEDAGLMQIFVFNKQTNPDDHISAQQAALNSPEVFTANTISHIKHWGKYDGKGLVMDGVYKGGIIKGKITVFAYSTDKSSFLIIRQDVGSHESVKADFDRVENSFTLK
jgi:hypothetical protein